MAVYEGRGNARTGLVFGLRGVGEWANGRTCALCFIPDLVLAFVTAATAQSTEIEQLRLAAEQGDAAAQFNLGVMYQRRWRSPGLSGGRAVVPPGGGLQPGTERPSWPGAVPDDPGRGVGDGEAGGARRAEEPSGRTRAGGRPQAGGAAGARDRRGRGAAEGDL